MTAILQVLYVSTHAQYLDRALRRLLRCWVQDALCAGCDSDRPALDPHGAQATRPISKPAAVTHTGLFLLLAQALGAAGCASTSLGDRCLIRSWLALHIPQQPGGIQL